MKNPAYVARNLHGPIVAPPWWAVFFRSLADWFWEPRA